MSPARKIVLEKSMGHSIKINGFYLHLDLNYTYIFEDSRENYY